MILKRLGRADPQYVVPRLRTVCHLAISVEFFTKKLKTLIKPSVEILLLLVLISVFNFHFNVSISTCLFSLLQSTLWLIACEKCPKNKLYLLTMCNMEMEIWK